MRFLGGEKSKKIIFWHISIYSIYGSHYYGTRVGYKSQSEVLVQGPKIEMDETEVGLRNPFPHQTHEVNLMAFATRPNECFFMLIIDLNCRYVIKVKLGSIRIGVGFRGIKEGHRWRFNSKSIQGKRKKKKRFDLTKRINSID